MKASLGRILILLVLAAASGGTALAQPLLPINAIVLAIAREYRDGGGFNWDEGSGTPEEIRFQGRRILSKGKGGTYCCGFTFAVAMKAAERAGLLHGKSVGEIRKFQREWYGATPASADRQCALAIENLGIGREIPLRDAQPGDFVRLWRTTCGHSVVFVRWVVEGGRRVGMEYRGTQGSTAGIGNAIEYLKGVRGHEGTIDLRKTHVARLAVTGRTGVGSPQKKPVPPGTGSRVK
jgi:hypothetical protein